MSKLNKLREMLAVIIAPKHKRALLQAINVEEEAISDSQELLNLLHEAIRKFAIVDSALGVDIKGENMAPQPIKPMQISADPIPPFIEALDAVRGATSILLSVQKGAPKLLFISIWKYFQGNDELAGLLKQAQQDVLDGTGKVIPNLQQSIHGGTIVLKHLRHFRKHYPDDYTNYFIEKGEPRLCAHEYLDRFVRTEDLGRIIPRKVAEKGGSGHVMLIRAWQEVMIAVIRHVEEAITWTRSMIAVEQDLADFIAAHGVSLNNNEIEAVTGQAPRVGPGPQEQPRPAIGPGPQGGQGPPGRPPPGPQGQPGQMHDDMPQIGFDTGGR